MLGRCASILAVVVGVVSLTVALAGCEALLGLGSLSDRSAADSSTGDDSSIGDDSAMPDAGTVKDSSRPRDANKPDTTTVQDSSVTPDTGPAMTCPANFPFTPFTWAPPTALHQNACTSAQAMAYSTSIMGTGPFTSGSATCDACIQTDQGAPAHGPVVSVGGTPEEANYGGCVADETGLTADMASGGCGNQVNDNNDCLVQECQGCSDFANPTMGGATNTCITTVLAAGAVCASANETTACMTELNTDGGVQTCLNASVLQLIELWCGP